MEWRRVRGAAVVLGALGLGSLLWWYSSTKPSSKPRSPTDPNPDTAHASNASPAGPQDAPKLLQRTESHTPPQEAHKRLEDMDRKRAAVIEELIATERTYVTKLNKIVDEFYHPLVEKAKAKGLSGVTEEDVHNLFTGILPIQLFNKQLLEMLVEGKESIGKIFNTVANFLKVYTEYIRTYDNRNELLQSWIKKKKNFSKFVKSRSEPLSSLMITPIQRIPRYVLLLKSLIENTQPKHADYENLKKSLVLVEGCCSHINEIKRFSDSGGLIVELQGWIEGDFDNLIAPHRKLIKNSSFKSHEVDDAKEIPSLLENPPKLSERKIYLFNDLFLWTSSKNTFKGAIELMGSKVSIGTGFFKDGTGSEEFMNSSFKKGRLSMSLISKLRPASTPIRLESLVVITSKDQSRNLIFQATSDEDAKEWVSLIEETIENAGSGLASSPPAVVSDTEDGDTSKEDAQ